MKKQKNSLIFWNRLCLGLTIYFLAFFAFVQEALYFELFKDYGYLHVSALNMITSLVTVPFLIFVFWGNKLFFEKRSNQTFLILPLNIFALFATIPMIFNTIDYLEATPLIFKDGLMLLWISLFVLPGLILFTTLLRNIFRQWKK